jgi:hypothetical protein
MRGTGIDLELEIYATKLALSKGPNRVGVSLHWRRKQNKFPKRRVFSSNYLESGRWTKSENPVILYDWHGM